MQTVLGAGGPIGNDLARMLYDYSDRVQLVGRHPRKVVEANETFAADLTDRDAVHAAVAGSDVVYLVAGMPYKATTWQALWPRVMHNTIEACRAHDARLVFFDNIYMYDRDCLDGMDEDTPVRPSSRKGEVRARIADMLMEAHARGDVRALIARCADFYGPGRQANSVLTQMVFDRLAAGKSAQWLLSADHRHAFTFTADASSGTAMLGNDESAYGQVWHLPTAPNPPTGRQWVAMIAAALGARPRLQLARDWMLRVVGVVNPVLREVREMAYQYDRHYVFASDRFDSRYGFTPTAYEDGIRIVVDSDYPR